MKKKIVIASCQLSGGGAERVATVWANKLSEHGFDVGMVCFYRMENEYFLNGNVTVYSIAKTKEEYLSLPYFKRFKLFRNYFKSARPHYVIPVLPTIQIWCDFAAAGLGIKKIATVINNLKKDPSVGKIGKFLLDRSYRHADKIILQTESQHLFFPKKLYGKCKVVPNTISDLYVKNFKEDTSENPREFIAAGRVNPQKNYKVMIDAILFARKKYPDIKLRIFGVHDSDYSAGIEKYIKEIGLENTVTLEGRNPHLEEEYKKSDFFLMSSDYEGLPNALIEAMASRLIAVSTDCETGPRDLIDDGENGFLVPVGDAQKFAEAIIKAIKTPLEKRKQMADKAREKILSLCGEENTLKLLLAVFD